MCGVWVQLCESYWVNSPTLCCSLFSAYDMEVEISVEPKMKMWISVNIQRQTIFTTVFSFSLQSLPSECCCCHLLPPSSCVQLAHLTYLFSSTELLHVDWRRICIYTCVRCGHDASLTTFRSGLADRITMRPQCVSSVFTPVLSCGHEQSDCYPIAKNACWCKV